MDTWGLILVFFVVLTLVFRGNFAIVADCNHPDSVPCGDNVTCIWSDLWCNGHSDCPNRTDEWPIAACDRFCSEHPDRFQCRGSHGTQCIVTSWRCDGDRDCPDNSDEWDCESFCRTATDRFQCRDQSSRCVPMYWRCNDRMDCNDKSDEEDCESFCSETPQRFQCASSRAHCINTNFRCNGVRGCPDNSDEWGCQANCSSDLAFQCGGNSTRCYDHKYRCDGSADCLDASDEEGCELYCQTQGGQTLCPNSTQCLAPSALCDGATQCRNGADEIGCKALCEREQGFLCDNSTRCLLPTLTSRCNGLTQCAGGEDERDCDMWCEDRGSYLCPHSSKCIAVTAVCDSHIDCPGGREEVDCGKMDRKYEEEKSKGPFASMPLEHIIGMTTGSLLVLLLFIIIVIVLSVKIRRFTVDPGVEHGRREGRPSCQHLILHPHGAQREGEDLEPPPPCPRRVRVETLDPADHVYERVEDCAYNSEDNSSAYERPYAIPAEVSCDGARTVPFYMTLPAQHRLQKTSSTPPSQNGQCSSHQSSVNLPAAPTASPRLDYLHPTATLEDLPARMGHGVQSSRFPRNGLPVLPPSSSSDLPSDYLHPTFSLGDHLVAPGGNSDNDLCTAQYLK